MSCECGHLFAEHIELPGHPDGVEECQADGCECGEYRARGYIETTESYRFL